MAIRNRSPREQAALHFKAAGLGDRSAREAARLLFETGISFESAAVLGQCAGEPLPVVAKVREEADRYRRAGEGPRTTSAWGRPVAEAQPVDAGPSRSAEAQGPRTTSAWGRPVAEAQPVDAGAGPSRSAEGQGRGSSSPVKTTQAVQPGTRTINGVEHYVVHEYTPVEKPAARDLEESGPRRSAWGRELTGD